MAKSTNAEIEKRILEVYTMLCQGYTYTDIVRYCSTNYGKITSRQIDKYISKATNKIRTELSVEIEDKRKIYEGRYNKWIREVETEIKNLKNLKAEGISVKESISALYHVVEKMQARLDKINGLEVQKIDLTSQGEKLNNIDFSKLTEEEAKELRLKMIAEMNVKE